MADSRNEAILENMLGAENQLEAPQSRNEKILHNMLGASYELDAPQSRIEKLLLEILKQAPTQTEEEIYGEIILAEYGS